MRGLGWVLILMLLPNGMTRAQLTLVQEGVPRAVIVLPSRAGEVLQLAAGELQTHVGLISGARLPCVDEGAAPPGVEIHLGPTVAVREADLPLTEVDIGYDGYVIRTGAHQVLIAGSRDQGTLNGVYGFLEDYLGVRWYYPGRWGTHVPQQTTITLAPIQEVNKPRFAQRRPWYNGNCTAGYSESESREYSVWVRRNRQGGWGGYVGHHWNYSVPPERYFEAHPDYYSEIQGERRPLQLCTSNPEVAALYTQDILSRFAADPEFRFASMSPNDGAGWCECEKCRAVSPDLTSRIVTFINQVARKVGPDYPDRYVAFYAYAGIVNPPQEDLPLEPNVMPWMAHYSVCQMHPLSDPTCPYQAGFRRKIEGWKAISELMGIREYASWWPVPCCESLRIAQDTRYYASLGAVGMSREYLEVQYGTPLLMWLEHHLLWNPDQELSGLLADFFHHFYGPVGPPMQSVYETLQECQSHAAPPTSNWTGNSFEAPGIYPREKLEEAWRRVQNLEEELGEGLFRERVGRERRALEHAVKWRDAWTADRQYAASGRREDKRAAIEKLTALVEFRDAFPDNHIVSRIGRNWAAGQIQLYTTDRTTITRAGDWSLEDNYNAGGMVRQDAEEFVGLSTGTWGLVLGRGGEGYVQYHFVAEGGLRFTQAELFRLYLSCPEGGQNRIEIQRDDGDWQVFSQNQTYSGEDHIYSLTDHIRGSREFRLRFWGRNGGDQEVLLLDHFGIRGRAE